MRVADPQLRLLQSRMQVVVIKEHTQKLEWMLKRQASTAYYICIHIIISIMAMCRAFGTPLFVAQVIPDETM